MTRQKPENPYAQAYANFLKNTSGHALKIVHADGLHRHLRMADPSQGSIWSWGIVTWPGHLATYGDIGAGYVFTRETDMLDFFAVPKASQDYYSDGAPAIDVRYWAEKLVGPRMSESTRRYSPEVLLGHVADALLEDDDLGLDAQEEYEKTLAATAQVCKQHGRDLSEHLAELAAPGDRLERLLDIDPDQDEHGLLTQYYGREIPAISPSANRAALLDEAREVSHSSDAARAWLDEHSELFGPDTWEWDLTDTDSHFVFACYALNLTVQAWQTKASVDADDMVERARRQASGDAALIAGLVARRRELGLPQNELANQLGVAQGEVAEFERYDADPTLSSVRAYAHALGVSISHVTTVATKES